MQRGWVPPWRWIFAAATLLGVFSAVQAYRYTALVTGSPVEFLPLLWINVVYWYVPALLTPTIFRLAHGYRFDRLRWPKALAVHLTGITLFSIVHVLCMIGMRFALVPDAGKPAAMPWWEFVQRMYLINFDWTMMTYSSLVGLSLAADYYREARARAVRTAQLEAKLLEAQLRTLQTQLQPHFLFNTLHAISALVHRNPDAADRMISRLSDLLRLTLDNSGVQSITLDQELDFLRSYLEIEQTRFQDRLEVRFDIDPSVLDVSVPRLILQPLVENAIKHGITPYSEQALIEVAARPDGDRLWMQVRDNGAGLSVSALAALEKGIGLSNTRARLQCLYGPDHRLEFSNREGGLAVRIVIPMRTEVREVAGDTTADDHGVRVA